MNRRGEKRREKTVDAVAGEMEEREKVAGKMEKKKRKLVKYDELPEYLKDNEYILDHYRCEWPLKDTFLSVFSLHNETLNIWTHLGGFVIFAAMTVASLMDKTKGEGPISSFFRTTVVATPLMTVFEMDSNNGSKNARPDTHFRHFSSSFFDTIDSDFEFISRWPWFVFLAGAMCCLIFSSISHLLACHSKRLNIFFWRLDYAGISIMIICSFFAPIYYTFYCQPLWSTLYLSSITLLGILAITTLLAPSLSSPCFRKFRASLFLSMGFSGVIPAVHAATLHWGHSDVIMALGYEVLMGILYATGASFYVSRVPERWKPGAFDLAGHSHQIFHVFVVGGALAHSAATLVILNWRRAQPIC